MSTENTMKQITKRMKADSFQMASLSEDTRNNILAAVKEALLAHREEIFEANKLDTDRARSDNLPDPVQKRLLFDAHKLEGVIEGIDQLVTLADPLNRKLMDRELDDGLRLVKTTCPIGVIGIIFESRPDALVQISEPGETETVDRDVAGHAGGTGFRNDLPVGRELGLGKCLTEAILQPADALDIHLTAKSF